MRSGYRNGRLIYPVSVVDHKQSSGSGSGGTVGYDSVGSSEIIDNSIQSQDLNKSVRDRLNEGFATSEDIAQIFNQDA